MVSNSFGVVSERKGLFQAMSSENRSSMTSHSNRENSSFAASRGVLSRFPLSRSAFRPWAIVFLGLSLSVTLWGFGYKLSRYYPQSDATSRALIAKLWDKHQDVTQITAAAEASSQPPHSELVLHAGIVLLCQPPDPRRSLFIDSDECQRIPISFQPVVPLRSPPSSSLVA